MCAIAGISGENIGQKLNQMLISQKHRGPDITGYWIDGNVFHGDPQEKRYLDFPDASVGLGHNLLSIVGCEGSQPLVKDNLVLLCNGEIYNFRELKNSLNEEFTTDSDCEVILNLIKSFSHDNVDGLLKPLQKTMKLLDGDYAFALFDGKNLALARDPVGVKPLYYGTNNKFNAFASERKALWDLGIREVHTLPPGHILLNGELFQVENLFDSINSSDSLDSSDLLDSPDSLESPDFSADTIEKKQLKAELDNLEIQLRNQLKTALETSVKKRVRGLDEVALIFSGGVDSTILACILKKLNVNPTLYTVGTENSQDMGFAQKAADFLNLKLRTLIVDEETVKNNLGPVITAIEEFNVMKIGVAMPAYLAAKMIHEDGLRVAFSGQGADELFGGYHRYLKAYEEMGEKTQDLLKHDVQNIYHVNLERDDAATMAHSVELRVPFLDKEVIKVALNIPIKYKIENQNDKIRKHILRQIALEWGVPEFIANRPKKAAQYGSGIHKILIKKVLREFDQEAFMKNMRGF